MVQDLRAALESSKQAVLAAQRQHGSADPQGGPAGGGAAAVGAAATGGLGRGGQPYWLSIGIPTVPRSRTNTSYLTTTLTTLLDELPADPSGEPAAP